MIKEFFHRLTCQKGVEAVGIFRYDGRLLDSWLSHSSNDNVLKDVGESYLHVFSALSRPEMSDLLALQLVFDKGMVFACAGKWYYLVVVLRSNADLNLVRLTAECCVSATEENRKTQRMLKKLPERKLTRNHFRNLDEVEKIMLDHIFEVKHES